MKMKQLIKEMNQNSKKLMKENQMIFDKILLKIRFSNLAEKDAEEFSYHCLNLLLQAEAENREATDILGTSDIDDFCNEYIHEVRENYSMLKKIILVVQFIPLIVFYTVIWDIVFNFLIPTFIKQRTISLDYPVNPATIINVIVIMLLVKIALHYLPQMSWDLNYGSKKEDRKWTIRIFLISCLTIAFFVVTGLLFTQVLFELNIVIFFVISILLYILLNNLVKKLD